MILAITGALAIFAGACLLYLASPNQCLWPSRMPGRLLAWAGATITLAGQVLLWLWTGPATALFVGITMAMTVLTLAPLLAGWLRTRERRA